MKVVSVHPHRERPWVTLENGELAYADVLVGCDGSAWKDWVTRTSVLKAFGQGDIAEPTGMQIFKYAYPLQIRRFNSCVLPRSVIVPDVELDSIKDDGLRTQLRTTVRG